MDGYYSIIRYYLNNFNDGFRQDSMHLLLGQYKVMDVNGNLKPLHGPGGPPRRRLKNSDSEWFTQFLPLVFSFTLAMSVLCCIFPTGRRLTYSVFDNYNNVGLNYDLRTTFERCLSNLDNVHLLEFNEGCELM